MPFTTKKNFERNERYFAKTGYGCGPVMSDPKHVEVLRSLTKEQIEALLHLFFLSDIYEVDSGELILGRWKLTKEEMENDKEAETMAQLAASLVYLSGHLAEDFPFLTDNGETPPKEGKLLCGCEKCLAVHSRDENVCPHCEGTGTDGFNGDFFECSNCGGNGTVVKAE